MTHGEKTNPRRDLNMLARQRELVQIKRVIDEIDVRRGFLVGATRELALLHSLTDRFDLDGYEVLRIGDIDELRSDFEKKEFLLRTLRRKGSIRSHSPMWISTTSVLPR